MLVYCFALDSVEVKLLAYPDDISVFCTDIESVSEALSLTRNPCSASDAAVNLTKKLRDFLWPLGLSVDYSLVRWS